MALDPKFASSLSGMGRALASEPRDLEKARQLALAALEYYRSSSRTRAPDLEQVEQWLAGLRTATRAPVMASKQVVSRKTRIYVETHNDVSNHISRHGS